MRFLVSMFITGLVLASCYSKDSRDIVSQEIIDDPGRIKTPIKNEKNHDLLYEDKTLNEAIEDSDIISVYLTWEQEETSTSQTVYYISNNEGESPTIHFDVESHNGDRNEYANNQEGVVSKVPGAPIYTHRFSLDNLAPDTVYYFTVGDSKNKYAQELRFRTLPNDDSPIEFLTGGDMSSSSNAQRVTRNAVTENTRVLFVGGDIAYANGEVSNTARWERWFRRMHVGLMNPAGYLVPMILAIGNHETNGTSRTQPLKKAPFYFSLFNQDGLNTNFARKIGGQGLLIVLDTGHIKQHADQQDWLRETLETHAAVKNKFALYHAPLYPTHRNYTGGWATRGREYWGPLFDQYKLTLAFENHDHTLKRTKPIFDNAVAEEGTIFLGEGCWGVGTRSINRRWYHEVVKSKRHVWRIRMSSSKIEGEAVGEDGSLLDSFELAR